MAIHGDLLLEAWMDPGNPGNPGGERLYLSLVRLSVDWNFFFLTKPGWGEGYIHKPSKTRALRNVVKILITIHVISFIHTCLN